MRFWRWSAGFEKLKVRVKVGVPAPESVDKEKLKAAVIYAEPSNVHVKVCSCCLPADVPCHAMAWPPWLEVLDLTASGAAQVIKVGYLEGTCCWH